MSENKLPTYVCHKEVQAGLIRLTSFRDGTASHLLHLDDVAEPIVVTAEWFQRHKVQAGGYYVVYSDGYASFSPAAQFNEGYSLKVEPA